MSQLNELQTNEKKMMTHSITFSHHWIIHNFAQFYCDDAKLKWEICSNKFASPSNDTFKFYIRLYLNNKADKDGGYLGIRLVPIALLLNQLNGQMAMNWNWSIVDKSGKKYYSKGYTSNEMFASIGQVDDEYIQLSKLLDAFNGYLKEGKLILENEITLTSTEPVFSPSPTSTSPSVTHSDATVPVVHLSHTFTIDHFEWMMMQKESNAPSWISSDYFAPDNEQIGHFRIDLHLFREGTLDKSSIAIAIVNHNAVNANVHWKVSLVDEGGERCYEEENEHKIGKNSEIKAYFCEAIFGPYSRLLTNDKLIIQCELDVMADDIPQLRYFPQDTKMTTSTVDVSQYHIHRAHLTWSIDRFMTDCFHKRVIINSESFQPSTDSKYSFRLRLHPKESDNADYTAIQLSSSSSLPIVGETDLQYRIGAAGKVWNSWERNISKSTQFNPISLLHHHTLKQFSHIILPNDTLTISCDVNNPLASSDINTFVFQIWIWKKRK